MDFFAWNEEMIGAWTKFCLKNTSNEDSRLKRCFKVSWNTLFFFHLMRPLMHQNGSVLIKPIYPPVIYQVLKDQNVILESLKKLKLLGIHN